MSRIAPVRNVTSVWSRGGGRGAERSPHHAQRPAAGVAAREGTLHSVLRLRRQAREALRPLAGKQTFGMT